MNRLFLFLLILRVSILYAQDLPAYKIYNSKGKEVSFNTLKKQANAVDLVLFGEFHDNPIAHWLQLELTAQMYAAHGKTYSSVLRCLSKTNKQF